MGNRKSFPKFAGMKVMPFVIGFLFALVACTEKTQVPEPEVAEHGRSVEGPSPELCAIDSLMWHQPDSALMRLLPYFNDTCCRDVSRNVSENANNDTLEDVARYVSTTTAYNRHYAHLLLAELLYKNDYAQTNRTELLQAVTYFDSLVRQAGGARRAGDSKTTSNLAFLDARAHYINGVGYYEQDSLVQACAEYLKTLEIMESHFEKDELTGHRARFMTYTYNRLGDMFSEQYMMEPAIACFQQSYEFCKIAPISSYSMSNALYRIGLQYNKMHKKDTANYYYERAIELMPDNNNLTYRDLESSRALLSYQMGQPAEASLSTLLRMVRLADDEEEQLTRFFTIGYIYFEEAMYDSALRYLEPVFQNTNDVVMQIQAADIIRVIYDSVGMGKNADEYVRFSAVNKKSNGENNAMVSKLENMFKVHTSQVQQKQAEEKRERSIRKAIGIIVLIAVAVVLGILVLAKLRSKKMLKEQQEEADMMLETERHSHKMQQAALAGRLRQSNAALKAQSKAASPIAPLPYKQDQNEAESYAEEPVCQQILAVCNDKSNPVKSTIPVSSYAGIALTDAQKAQLKDAAMRHYGPLFEKLKLQYPELKEKDFLYCYLCLLGLDNMQIAVLTQLSYRTIWEREKRLQTLFHADDRIAVVLHEMMIH